ncbi:hypothetical protein [Psychromonas aquimarina]|uniref:hypothetical protein n=1 Tax=Psychromonas aquimarina TaxID=444919 RepID=UPI00041F7C7A|nr:hypothetical protein [Psychromonas aquimarina]
MSINSISGGLQQPSIQINKPTMSAEQRETAVELLSNFDADALSTDDAVTIAAGLAEAGISPGKELAELMKNNGFDAQSIGETAGADSRPMPPQPPAGEMPQAEMFSYLEEILAEYDSSQLSDSDKDSILAAVQSKFGLSSSDSIIDITA